MAKGFEKHQERMSIISSYGKDLVRRSGACCELCSDSGTKLTVYEVPPVQNEPDFDQCIFICDTCREQLENPKRLKPDHWRCLNNTIWTELEILQVQSAAILMKLEKDHNWAAELLEQAMLPEEIIEAARKV